MPVRTCTEIFVTATRRANRIQTPIAVNALSEISSLKAASSRLGHPVPILRRAVRNRAGQFRLPPARRRIGGFGSPRAECRDGSRRSCHPEPVGARRPRPSRSAEGPQGTQFGKNSSNRAWSTSPAADFDAFGGNSSPLRRANEHNVSGSLNVPIGGKPPLPSSPTIGDSTDTSTTSCRTATGAARKLWRQAKLLTRSRRTISALT